MQAHRDVRTLAIAVSLSFSACSKCSGPTESAPPAASARARDAGAPPVVERDPATFKRGAACPPDMVAVPIGGCIDRYEASEGPDGAAVSAPGKKPHVDLTVVDAAKACAKAGKYLCGEAQWVSACQGEAKNEYPYGPKFEPMRCNDWQLSDAGAGGARPTGSLPKCVTAGGAFDMANNVAELTSHTGGGNMYEARGGSYFTTVHDSACDEDDNRLAPHEHYPVVGYRCCTDGTGK